MNTDRRKRSGYEAFEEGMPSQPDDTVQRILHKQMDTHLTLSSQFEQHRDFHEGGELHSLPLSSGGLRSVHDLKSIEQEDDLIKRLLRAGLTTQEISFYFQASRESKVPLPCSSYTCEPRAFETRLKEIEEKLVENNSDLGPDNCNGDSPSKNMKNLEDPFTYIARFAKKFESTRRNRKNKKLRITAQPSQEVQEVAEHLSQPVDPSVLHAVVPLEDSEITSNRLSLQEIHALPRFSQYTPGEPNCILYLKNLHAKVRTEELIALFGRYDTQDTKIGYRLLTGKMKGQAFVTFTDSTTASEALSLINGYCLRGQPIVISYGQQRERCKS